MLISEVFILILFLLPTNRKELIRYAFGIEVACHAIQRKIQRIFHVKRRVKQRKKLTPRDGSRKDGKRDEIPYDQRRTWEKKEKRDSIINYS